MMKVQDLVSRSKIVKNGALGESIIKDTFVVAEKPTPALEESAKSDGCSEDKTVESEFTKYDPTLEEGHPTIRTPEQSIARGKRLKWSKQKIIASMARSMKISQTGAERIYRKSLPDALALAEDQI